MGGIGVSVLRHFNGNELDVHSIIANNYLTL